MLTVEEAILAILNHVVVSTANNVDLRDCLQLVLAQNLSTPHDSPPFDKSMMDGFAVHSASFDGTGDQKLRVLETITAGTIPSFTVERGTASQIMTGAPIPAGADCVVPIERVKLDESHPETLTVCGSDVAAERHILRQGSTATSGEPLMKAGTLLEPQHIAVLAEFGVANVPTYRRPTVGVLATGDELLSIDQPLTPGRIRNSNEPMLVSQIQRAGGNAVPLGIAKDSRADLSVKIQKGLECDFLLLSGGVSAGTMDLVPSELAAAGVVQVFHKIQMKPGKPLWFGQLHRDNHTCWVFGLPGNPVSSMICFELFVRTALRKFAGSPSPEPRYIQATLTEPVTVKGDRPTYFPSRLEHTNTGTTATPVQWGGSADLRSTADANGMCLLVPKTSAYSAEEIVEAIIW